MPRDASDTVADWPFKKSVRTDPQRPLEIVLLSYNKFVYHSVLNNAAFASGPRWRIQGWPGGTSPPLESKKNNLKKRSILGGKGVKKWSGPPLRKIFRKNIKAPSYDRVLDPPLVGPMGLGL